MIAIFAMAAIVRRRLARLIDEDQNAHSTEVLHWPGDCSDRPMKHEITIAGAGCGELRLAEHPAGIVILVHGSGIDRHDSRNRLVAARLVRAGFGALLVDLLDECAAHDRHNAFDVELQAERLVRVTQWLRAQPGTAALPVGYFGTGVGAGVALVAAAKSPQGVGALVCRGGRPDTALHWLAQLQVPALFMAAAQGADGPWAKLAHQAAGGAKELVRIRHASDSFSEAGAMEAVAEHACRWFSRHMGPLAARIRGLEARLRQRHPGLDCRVTLEDRVPHAYERRRFNVRLDVCSEGRSMVVNREHDHDPALALREAFAAAHRQLDALHAGIDPA
jgi:dienelactone hydrolase